MGVPDLPLVRLQGIWPEPVRRALVGRFKETTTISAESLSREMIPLGDLAAMVSAAAAAITICLALLDRKARNPKRPLELGQEAAEADLRAHGIREVSVEAADLVSETSVRLEVSAPTAHRAFRFDAEIAEGSVTLAIREVSNDSSQS